MRTRRHPRRQAGFSLVELMISLAIGMVVVGAVFAAYVGSGQSSRHTRAMAQITEDASIALSVLRSAISATSYINPTNSNADGFVGALGDGRTNTLRGCSNSFSDVEEAVLQNLDCEAGDGPNAIAVNYEADAQNSAVSATNVPLDCLGNEIPATGAVYLAYQRFFIEDSALKCKGPVADVGAQALVDHVVDMQIRYGVAGAAPDLHRVVRYMSASDMDQALFDQTLSVRVCVTIASEDNVLDASSQYVNCAGDKTDPPGGADDRHMYRSFTSTIVLPNRLEGRL